MNKIEARYRLLQKTLAGFKRPLLSVEKHRPLRSKARHLMYCAAFMPVMGFGLNANAQTINCKGRLVTSVDFQNPVLIAGVDLQAGAVYRFSNITTGVDATVEILGFTGGATLNFIDRDIGLVNFFQPELNANQVSSANFLISFVEPGTLNPVELDIAASGIDIDGNNASLREYSEFENTLVESLLSDPTALAQNASGPSAPNRIRFESATLAVAPGIDETASENIVTVFYTDTSSFEYSIGALGTGVQTRLTSLGFTCPNLANPVATSQIEEDFGDAPASYGNPIHTLVADFRLGALNSPDAGPFDSPTASGDGGDDGVSAFPAMTETLPANFDVSVTGAGGFLQVFIDWNGDGDFDEANERVATDLQDDDGNGLITVNYIAAGDVTTDPLFARLRWSSTQGLEPDTAVANGEVEDYQIAPITQGVANVTANKTVEVFDPAGEGLYLTPGNEVIYRITAVNSDSSNVAASDIVIVDTLPDNVVFISAEATGFLAGAFGSPDLPQSNTDCAQTACIVRYSGGSLDVDSSGAVIIRAQIK